MIVFLTDGTGRWFDTAAATQKVDVQLPTPGIAAKTKTGKFVLATHRATVAFGKGDFASCVELTGSEFAELLEKNGYPIPPALLDPAKEI